MIRWRPDLRVYLHRDPVDFRKQINGLSVLVQDSMQLSPFDEAVFVFCNKNRSQLKALYWDSTGFVLWQKRLEKERFKWPRKHPSETLSIDAEHWDWLLRGFDITQLKAHKMLTFKRVS